MEPKSQDFLERFKAMDTESLLQRYQAGGLIPDAEAALLSVLESRGYSREKLAQRDASRRASEMSREASLADKAKPRHHIPNSYSGLRQINLALKWSVIPVLIFFLLLAIPLLGNFVVIGGASLIGCQTGENQIHPCHFMGSDIGEFVYGYVMDVFVLGALNPFFALAALKAFICSIAGIVWLSIVIGIALSRERLRRRLAIDAFSPDS